MSDFLTVPTMLHSELLQCSTEIGIFQGVGPGEVRMPGTHKCLAAAVVITWGKPFEHCPGEKFAPALRSGRSLEGAPRPCPGAVSSNVPVKAAFSKGHGSSHIFKEVALP